MRKSTMVTLTSGDRHRFEPPRTQTAFIDLTNLSAKKLLQPTWLENYKALGFQTNSSWRGSGKKIRLLALASVAFVPSTRWYQAAVVELKKGQCLRDLDE